MKEPNDRFEMHVCPHCGQRNRVQGRAVCAEGERVRDEMVENAAKALLAGSEMGPQMWSDVFAWAHHVGQHEVLPRLEKELEALKTLATKRRGEIRRQSEVFVANRMHGKEGSVPAAVRDRAIEQIVRESEFEDETLKRAHGRGLGLEDLKKHLQWLEAQMGSDQRRQTA